MMGLVLTQILRFIYDGELSLVYFTAIAFLHGLVSAELRREELDYHGPYYEVLITVRAIKPLPNDRGETAFRSCWSRRDLAWTLRHAGRTLCACRAGDLQLHAD
jgi:hypothetical protein